MDWWRNRLFEESLGETLGETLSEHRRIESGAEMGNALKSVEDKLDMVNLKIKSGRCGAVKILAIECENEAANTDLFQRYAQEEARRAWEMYQAGIIRELYFRSDRQTAVLILECDSIEEAKGALANLPFVREKLIGFELIPLRAYSGFARLFGDESAIDKIKTGATT
jgi:hypothetical protein